MMRDSIANSGESFTVVQKFYELVTDEIYAAGGFVNKFLGDGALAVFEVTEQHLLGDVVIKAIMATQEIQTKVGQIIAGKLKVSAGIHYGDVIFATVGKVPKLEFTVLGDAVNVASRLCTVSKEQQNAIIASKLTVVGVSSQVSAIELGDFEIKGITGKMPLCAVFANNVVKKAG